MSTTIWPTFVSLPRRNARVGNEVVTSRFDLSIEPPAFLTTRVG